MKAQNLSLLGLITAMAMPMYSGNGQTPVAPPAPPTPVVAAPNYSTPLKINPSSNVDEVIKLSKSGVDDAVVVAFVKNSRFPYNLKADEILRLKDEGVSS